MQSTAICKVFGIICKVFGIKGEIYEERPALAASSLRKPASK